MWAMLCLGLLIGSRPPAVVLRATTGKVFGTVCGPRRHRTRAPPPHTPPLVKPSLAVLLGALPIVLLPVLLALPSPPGVLAHPLPE